MSRPSVAAEPAPHQPFDASSFAGEPRFLLVEGDHIAAPAPRRMLRELGYSERALETSLTEAAKALSGALEGIPLAVQCEDGQDRMLHDNPALRAVFGLTGVKGRNGRQDSFVRRQSSRIAESSGSSVSRAMGLSISEGSGTCLSSLGGSGRR